MCRVNDEMAKYIADIFCASKAYLELHSSNYVAQDLTKLARKRTSWMRQFIVDSTLILLSTLFNCFRHHWLHHKTTSAITCPFTNMKHFSKS